MEDYAFSGVPRWHSGKEFLPMQEMREMRVWSLGQEYPPGVGNGNPLQYSCLENFMDREAWQSTVHHIAKSQT